MFGLTLLGYTVSVIWMMMLFFLWIVIALLPANIARSKGHSFWLWFLISLFFWWVTLFVALFLPDRNTPTATTPPAATPQA